MAPTRELLHLMLDAIPDERLGDAAAALEKVTDPVLFTFLNAPEDDEPTTAEDLEALAEARAEYERGETIPYEVIRREFGW